MTPSRANRDAEVGGGDLIEICRVEEELRTVTDRVGGSACNDRRQRASGPWRHESKAGTPLLSRQAQCLDANAAVFAATATRFGLPAFCCAGVRERERRQNCHKTHRKDCASQKRAAAHSATQKRAAAHTAALAAARLPCHLPALAGEPRCRQPRTQAQPELPPFCLCTHRWST